MQSRVNRMSRNSAQCAHMLPSACAVLTCVFACACVISAQSMSNARVPVSFLGHSIDTWMQVDSTCTAGLIQHAQYQHMCMHNSLYICCYNNLLWYLYCGLIVKWYYKQLALSCYWLCLFVSLPEIHSYCTPSWKKNKLREDGRYSKSHMSAAIYVLLYTLLCQPSFISQVLAVVVEVSAVKLLRLLGILRRLQTYSTKELNHV